MKVQDEGDDFLIRKDERKGVFSVKSFYSSLCNDSKDLVFSLRKRLEGKSLDFLMQKGVDDG